MTRLLYPLLLLPVLVSPALAEAPIKPFSALTEGDQCFMDCRRANQQCRLDCREQHPKDSREAFECVLACGDKVDHACKRECGLAAPADR